MPSAGKLIITFIAVITSVGGYMADFNHTHIYNERWPGHAKFHAGQTMSMGLTLGLLTLFILYRPSSRPSSMAKSSSSASEDYRVEKERLQYATLVAALYWVTQASAVLYPGSLTMDPEFGTGGPQLHLDAVLLGLLGLGYRLESNVLEVARVKAV